MVRIFHPLDDFKLSDLPAKAASNWKLAGPGAILVGLSIGAGEIIIWPRIAAQFGATMVWAAVLGVFLQMFINLEVARWTVATGETVYTGYARVWRGFGLVFIMFNVLGWLAPGWGRASGLALKALLVGPSGWGSDTFWTALTFGGVSAVLFGPKLVYKSVERTVSVLVVTVLVGLIVVAIAVGDWLAWKDLGAGIANVGYIDPGIDARELFSAIVFAGAGGTANLFYTFYLRDKQIGMGGRLPEMGNPLRVQSQKVPATGFTFDNTQQNKSRFRAWWGYIVQDQLIFFFALNAVTMLLFIFGALAVLHREQIVPEPGQLIWDEAEVLARVWGKAGRTIFLLVGLATLFSTQVTVLDGVSRSVSDIIYTNFNFGRKRDVSWWYLLTALFWITAGIGITYIQENRAVSELGFLLNAAYMGGFAMAVYVPLQLFINHYFLPKSARPGVVCTLMMLLASIVYVGFAITCLWSEVQSFVGR
jgi:Mn2+/Fe2+ NRAMP family transporter